MCGDGDSKWPLHLARALSLLPACLALGASFFPNERMWGINHLAFYPKPILFFAFAVIAVSYLPVTGRFVIRLSGRACNFTGGRKAAAAVMLAAAAFLLFWAFDSSTLILGDGRYIANNIENALTTDFRTFLGYFTQVDRFYPGTEALYLSVSRIFSSAFGAGSLAGVKILSGVFGVLFVLLFVPEIVRYGPSPQQESAVIAIILLLSGSVQFFFGYVEMYAPLLFFTFLYFFLARRVITEGATVWGAAVCVVVAVTMHVLGLVLVPSLCFLFIWIALRRRLSARLLIAYLIIPLATITAPIVASHIDASERFILPLAGGGGAYSILSGAHLIDIANELLLLFPGIIVLGILAIVMTARSILRSEHGFIQQLRGDVPGTFLSEFLFCVMLFVPAILTLVAVTPELGMARDWDLFAVSLVGLHAPVLVMLKHLRTDALAQKTLRSVLTPVLATTLVLTAAWVGINAHPARSIARFESILAYDGTNAGYAYENLASHYHETGDVDAEINALEHAYDASHNPRYLFPLGLRYYFIDKKDQAVQTLQKLLEITPQDEHARQSLIQMLYFSRRYGDVIEACMRGAGLSTDNPFYPFFTGKAFVKQGRMEEAVAAFGECLKLNPSPAMVEEINEFLKTVELNQPEQ